MTVNNTDRAPVLAAISDQTVLEGNAISQVDANDALTGNDTDQDGEAISYTCYWDNSSDDSVANINTCSTLPASPTFTASTGVLDWTTNNTTADTSAIWEIKSQELQVVKVMKSFLR